MLQNNSIRPIKVILTIKSKSTGRSTESLLVSLSIKDADTNQLVADRINNRLLPLPHQQLLDAYTAWNKSYLGWGGRHRFWQRPINPGNPELMETNVDISPATTESIQNAINLKNRLIAEFNNWLSVSPELSAIRESLIEHITPQQYRGKPELLSIIIETATEREDLDLTLQRFPWDEWQFIHSRYGDNQGIALSTRDAVNVAEPLSALKALVIIGSYNKQDDIDLRPDLNVLRQTLGNGNIVKLEVWQSSTSNARLDLLEKLALETYHLIFFCGHSSDHDIHLSDNEYISMNDIQFSNILNGLKRRGLLLLFFNSCSGLDIARAGMLVGVPYIVVMKEVVHDRVAQEFIRHFLEAAIEPARPIHIAFNIARRKLQWLRGLPHGEFLPVLFQNPEQQPFCLVSSPIESQRPMSSLIERQRPNKYLKYVIAAMAAIMTVVCIANYQIWLTTNTPQICQLISQNKHISCGDKVLLSAEGKESPGKSNGFGAIKEILSKSTINKTDVEKLEATIQELETDWKNTHDPETLIAIENAKIFLNFANNPKTLIKNIAVVIPMSGVPLDIPTSILNGVAYFQHQHNRMNKTNDWDLRVIIADDNNLPNSLERSKENAKILVKQTDILGIIGPYSSKDTISSIKSEIYKNLLLISPTATSHELTNDGINDRILFHRTAPSSEISAKKAVEEWVTENRKIVLFRADGPFSQSFRESFRNALKSNKKYQNKKIEDIIVDEFLLEKSDTYNSIKSKLEKTKANAIVLLPDAYIYSTKENQIFQQVLTANKGNKPILANSSVYDFFNNNYQNKSIPISQDMYKNLAIVVPWDYSNTKTKLRPEDDPIELPGIPKWWLNERPIDLLSQRTVMAYDASVVMSDILYHANNRSDVIKEITNPKFRSKGITGDITFDGSDRHEDTTSLITPDCKDNQCNGLFKPYVKK
jgi:branched-chain amino acid transport system substrate-binding protein